MNEEKRKPSPEELLRRVEADEQNEKRGRLKIFLGYASGVGKSFRMVDEGRRRKMRGQDVVVGAVQSGVSADVERLLGGLEIIPPRRDLGLDVEALLRRRPGVCLIDGLAYRNPPGSRNPERWQDVEGLLAAGISVIATINLQYVRERQSDVERIRGKRVSDSVPEAFLRTAEDIEVVDAPPEYCMERTQAGGLQADAEALERQLSELREVALLLAADVVDAQLDEYLKRHGIEQTYGTQERVLICVTPRSNAELMIARGRRQADRFHGELFVVYFEHGSLSEADRKSLDAHMDLARKARAHVETLYGEDFVAAVVEFCEKQGITQIFVGHSKRTGLWQRWFANPVERLIAESSGIDIRVFPNQ
jgi:two-component system, OmpR family, sensor histidine kinase KdpD